MASFPLDPTYRIIAGKLIKSPETQVNIFHTRLTGVKIVSNAKSIASPGRNIAKDRRKR